MSKLKTVLISTFIIVVSAAVVWGAYNFGKKSSTDKDLKTSPPPTSTPTSITPTEIINKNGVIEGSLGYPSEGIPETIVICAESLDNNETVCTNNHLKDSKYTYGIGYKIEVPQGKYHVYAYIPNFNQDYRAYYNDFVTCGFSIDCPSHKPIAVEVTASLATTNVDPQDWYNQ